MFEHPFQIVLLAGDPIGGNAFPGAVDDLLGEVDGLIEPRLEVVKRADVLVDQRSRIEALDGTFREVPVGAIEGIAVIDHAGYEGSLRRRFGFHGFASSADHGAIEDGLAAVRISGPFVEDQDGAKVLQVHDTGQ